MPNLAFVNAELIVQEGGLPPLVDLLASSNEGIQQQAAGALWSLSVNGAFPNPDYLEPKLNTIDSLCLLESVSVQLRTI
jgi:hypothetical protein